MVYHACISFTINRKVQTMAKSLLFLHAVAIIYYGILNIFTRMLKMMKGCVQAMNWFPSHNIYYLLTSQ